MILYLFITDVTIYERGNFYLYSRRGNGINLYILHSNVMSKRVLIFDDDIDILQVCSIVLKTKGFIVSTEHNCDKLVEQIQNFAPHVILMDNQIPSIGGIKATRLIKETEEIKNIPVIFFSANTEILRLSEQAGSEYFLQKPFDIDELESLVLKAVGENG